MLGFFHFPDFLSNKRNPIVKKRLSFVHMSAMLRTPPLHYEIVRIGLSCPIHIVIRIVKLRREKNFLLVFCISWSHFVTKDFFQVPKLLMKTKNYPKQPKVFIIYSYDQIPSRSLSYLPVLYERRKFTDYSIVTKKFNFKLHCLFLNYIKAY